MDVYVETLAGLGGAGVRRGWVRVIFQLALDAVRARTVGGSVSGEVGSGDCGRDRAVRDSGREDSVTGMIVLDVESLGGC